MMTLKQLAEVVEDEYSDPWGIATPKMTPTLRKLIDMIKGDKK